MENYFFVSAALLGLFGGLHCVGMCGPIVLWLPNGKLYFPLYGLGKTITYALMGFVLGIMGFSVKLAGFQQYFSLFIGVLIMFVLLGFQKIPGLWKTAISRKLQSTMANVNPFWIGFWSGFLPCGLVYAALAGALVLGNPVFSSLFMLIFGLATLPSLALFYLFSSKIKPLLSGLSNKIQSVFLFFMALLLILRGLNLGVPYVSPKQEPEGKMGACCSTKKSIQP